jgi:hypothetical protein
LGIYFFVQDETVILQKFREHPDRIVVQDFILKPDKTAPRHAALFALNWLVVTRKRNGNSYSADEYSAWLGKAGFRDIRHVLLPGSTGLMLGSKC